MKPREPMAWLRSSVNELALRLGFPPDWYLIPLAAFVGTAAGIVAVGYGQMVRFSEQTFFTGGVEGERAGISYWLILGLPSLGGLIVGTIKVLFRLPRISHGIPEVVEAMSKKGGRLALRDGVFTALNSAITLGSGGSTGQEGPIVSIGSTVGSKLGRVLKVGRPHMATLVGCGAAAGIAAIFNAPMAGVLLVLEVMLRDFSIRTFMPVVVASVFGVAANQLILGPSEALFRLERPEYHFAMHEIPPFLLMGFVAAGVGVLLIKTLHGLEHVWQRVRVPFVFKPALGGLILGVMGVSLIYMFNDQMLHYRPPAFMGNGYPVVEAMLNPASYAVTAAGVGRVASLSLAFLLVIALGKIVGTSMTLGSGGSGGMFAPALFVGAAVGGAFGLAMQRAGFYGEINPALYALTGMAGVLSASVHCPLTAIILMLEITQDYSTILPVMLVTIIATLVAQAIHRDSIYTSVLRQRGNSLRTRSEVLALLHRVDVASLPLGPVVMVQVNEPVQNLVEMARRANADNYIVVDQDCRYLGVVLDEDISTAVLQGEAVPLLVVQELMKTDVPAVAFEEPLDSVFEKFAEHHVATLAVIDDQKRVMGVISRNAMMQHYRRALGEAH